ncbi:MAG TPA: FtsX-like permease family protein, partial [Blastocatellia bacterium]
NDGAGVYVEGRPQDPSSLTPGSGYNCVGPDYFTVMQIPVVGGRAFTDADTAQSLPVVIIDQVMAKFFWPGQDPIGQRFSYQSPTGPWVTVVGVSGDARVNSVTDPPPRYFYVPQTQNYKSTHVLQLRTSGPPEALAGLVQDEIRALDPNLPVYDVQSMDQSLGSGANGFFLIKMGAGFAGTLGGLGLLLAIVGVYGVVSYNASQRRHEIGVRMALGARAGGIFGLVLSQAAILVGAGVGIGLVAAFGLTRFLSGLLIGVGAADPLTFGGVALLLVASALVACYLPAHRAARVDPATALRYE